jgi:cyclophilin family peptidyl-prolyl cis-trans isomerase
MHRLFVLTLSVFLIFSACKSADTQTKSSGTTQGTTAVTEQTKPADTGKLQKWPADYPVTGDSVALITVSQEGAGALGEIIVEFYPDKAPNHVRNFKWLADHGYYNNTKFHRVIKGFMIQGGDPLGTGGGGPGWTVNAEFNDILHTPGILSAARTNDPNSAGSQFFLMHGNAPHLNNQYSVFGKVIKGMDVVNKVAETPVGGPQNSTPVQAVSMTSCKIVARSSVKL